MLHDRIAELLALTFDLKQIAHPDGPPSTEITRRIRASTCRPTVEAISWHAAWATWCLPNEYEVLPGWHPCALESAIADHAIYKDMNTPGSRHQLMLEQMFGAEPHVPDKYIEPLWDNFCILSDGSDGGCGIGAQGASYRGRVVVRAIHAPWEIGFQSLDKLIDTAIAHRKARIWDAEGGIDWGMSRDIARAINPECSYWNHDG